MSSKNRSKENGEIQEVDKSEEATSEDSNNSVDPEATIGADIETGADTLLSFLEEETKFPVSEIAKDLGVPEKTVKIWGKALEKSGYIKISYSAIKGMVLEYDSDKSYDELNIGRSELPSNLDEIEIEVEEETIIEDEDVSGETKETAHKEEDEVEETVDDAERENINKEEMVSEPKQRNEDKPERRSSGTESFNRRNNRGNNTTRNKNNTGDAVNQQNSPNRNKNLQRSKKQPEDNRNSTRREFSNDSSVEDGKQKLKDELDKLDKKKKREVAENEEQTKTAKITAKKAKIRKAARKVRETAEEKNELKQETPAAPKEPVQFNNETQGNGHSVEKLGGHGEKLLEIGKELENPEKDTHEAYVQIEDELESLKDYIVENDLTNSEKEEIVNVMDELENRVEHSEEENNGFIKKLKEKIKELWEKHKPIEKVEE